MECFCLSGSNSESSNAGSSNSILGNEEDLDDVYRLLDPELRPETPDDDCPQSLQIFKEHKQLAQEYLKIQTEIALLNKQKNEILDEVNPGSFKDQMEINTLETEKVGKVGKL